MAKQNGETRFPAGISMLLLGAPANNSVYDSDILKQIL